MLKQQTEEIYGDRRDTNQGNVDIPDSLFIHSQEEEDTLLKLHTVRVPREAELVVSSPDTDVLLLLVDMSPVSSLPH